eukprot:2957225-Pleurochrysis_carterae.AAC.1
MLMIRSCACVSLSVESLLPLWLQLALELTCESIRLSIIDEVPNELLYVSLDGLAFSLSEVPSEQPLASLLSVMKTCFLRTRVVGLVIYSAMQPAKVQKLLSSCCSSPRTLADFQGVADAELDAASEVDQAVPTKYEQKLSFRIDHVQARDASSHGMQPTSRSKSFVLGHAAWSAKLSALSAMAF